MVHELPHYIKSSTPHLLNPPYIYIFSSALHFQTLVSYTLVRFEVLTVVMTKIQFSEDTTLCQLIDTYRHFRGACYLSSGFMQASQELIGVHRL